MVMMVVITNNNGIANNLVDDHERRIDMDTPVSF